MRAPGPLDPTMLPKTEPARARLRTVHTMLNAGWPALLAALSFLLTTNLSDSIFDNILGALQTLARAAGYLALPNPCDAFLTALAKAALPPQVVAGGGLVGSIFRGRWCIMSTCLYLSQLRELSEQRRLWHCPFGGRCCAQYSMPRVSAI